MSKPQQEGTLEALRLELANYHGLLARWADITHNVAPADVDRQEWTQKKFDEWLTEISTKPFHKRGGAA